MASENEIDVEALMAQTQASDGSILQRIESITFRVLELMLSDNGPKSSRREARSNLVALALFLVDWAQLTAILVSSETGWTFSWSFLDVIRQFSLLRILGIDTTTVAAFVVLWMIALAIMLGTLANAAYVAWQVRNGFSSGSLFPVRTLRSAATILLTAGYVPLVEMVSEPLSCERIQLRAIASGTTQECWGILHAPMFAVALPTLIVFISFAVTMRSVYFSDAPLSQAIMAKPIARNEVLDIMVRTAVVLLFLFLARSNPTVVLWICNVMYIMLTLQALAHLPYFKLTMTQFRVATYVSLVWVASGGCLIQGLRGAAVDESMIETMAFWWLAVTPVGLVIGALLAWWRQRFMERKGLSIAAFHVARQLELEVEEALLAGPDGSIDGSAGGISSTGPSPDEDGEAGDNAAGTDLFGNPASSGQAQHPHQPQQPPASYGARGPSLILPGTAAAASGAADATALQTGMMVKRQPTRSPAVTTSSSTLRGSRPMRRVPSGRAGADWAAAYDASSSPQQHPSATAAVAHVAGLGAAQRRKSSTREAEDVTELLTAAPGSIRDEQGGFEALDREAEGEAHTSHDDGSGTSSVPKLHHISSRKSARMLAGAVKVDREAGAQAGFVGRLMPADMSTGSGSGPGGRRDESFAGGRNGSKRDNDFTDTGVEDGLETGASGKGDGSAKPVGVSMQVEELLLAAAARARSKMGVTRGSASGGQVAKQSRRASMPGAQRTAGSSMSADGSRGQEQPESIAADFVAALRSELGHTTPASHGRSRRGSTVAAARRSSMVAARSGGPGTPHAGMPMAGSSGVGNSEMGIPAVLTAAQSRRLALPPPVTDKVAQRVLGITEADDEDPELDELIGSGPDPQSLESQSSHFWSSDTDVELFVRALLARPTQRRLKYARAVLDEALLVFPDSVFVRLTFTTYLFSRSTTYADVVLAMRLLGEAVSMQASLDMRFAVFSKLNAVLNARRRLVLGEGQPGTKQDALDLVDFKRGVRAADEGHVQAVKLMHQFWSALSHGASDGVTMRGAPISVVLGEISTAADTAERNYLHVLEKWPSSTTVQRAYGLFLLNVRHEKELGMAYLSMSEDRDDDLISGSASQARSAASGGRSMARSTRSSGSIMSPDTLKRKRMKIGSAASKRFVHSLADVASMRTGFRAGLFALLLIIIGMYILASTLFSTVRKTVSTMNGAGLRRKLAQSSLYALRGMRLAAQGNDSATFNALAAHGIAEMELLHTATTNLFFNGPQPADIFTQWNQPIIPIRVWGNSPPPGHMQTVQLGLLESSFVTIANVVRVCKLDMALLQGDWPANTASYAYTNLTSSTDPYWRIPEYRYVVENEPEMLRQLEYAANTYQAADLSTATITNWIMIACVVLRFAILLVLAGWVVRPAIDAIRWQKLHIRDLVMMLPQPLARHLSKRAHEVEKALSKASSASKGILDEIDPTSKIYQSLASTAFLTTMPDFREGSKRRKGRSRALPADENPIESIVAPTGHGQSGSSNGRKLDAIDEDEALDEDEDDDDEEEEDEGDADWLAGGGAAKGTPMLTGAVAAGGIGLGSRSPATDSQQAPLLRQRPGETERMPQSRLGRQVSPAKPPLTRVASGRQKLPQLSQPQRGGAASAGGVGGPSGLRMSDMPAGHYRDSKEAAASGGTPDGEPPSEAITMFDSTTLGDDTDLLEDVHDADELAVLLRKREEHATITAMRVNTGVEAATSSSAPSELAADSSQVEGGSEAVDSALDEMLSGTMLPTLSQGAAGHETAARAPHGVYLGRRGSGEDPVSPPPPSTTLVVSGERSSSSTGGRLGTAGILKSDLHAIDRLSARTGTSGAESAKIEEGYAGMSKQGVSGVPLRSGSGRGGGVGSAIVTSGARRPSSGARSARLSATSARVKESGSGWPCARCCQRRRRPGDARGSNSTATALRLASGDDATAEAMGQLSVCNNPMLRSIALRTAAVFTLLVVLMATTTIVFGEVIGNGGSLAATLNNAGRRRYLARSTLNQVRELVIADGQYGSVPELVARVQATLAFYEKVHRGLKLGDADLGLPPQDPSSSNGVALNELYYGDAGSGFDITATDALGLTDYSELGVEPLLQLFWQTARNLVRVYRDPAASRPPRTLSGMLSLPEFERLWLLERGDLGKKIGSAVGIYSNSDAATVDALEVQAYIVLSVEIVILAVAYLIVYESMSSALATEHLRASDISGLIPEIIRKAHPTLERAFGSKKKPQ